MMHLLNDKFDNSNKCKKERLQSSAKTDNSSNANDKLKRSLTTLTTTKSLTNKTMHSTSMSSKKKQHKRRKRCLKSKRKGKMIL